MYSPPLYLSYHQDIPKLDIFWPTDYDYFGIFQKKIFVFELKNPSLGTGSSPVPRDGTSLRTGSALGV